MRIWVEAARPRTLSAAVVPVLVGTATGGAFLPWRFAGALTVALALQVAVNYANDYFDGVRGVDTPDRVGPRRATASGLVKPGQMKTAIAVALGIAACAGLGLTFAVGPELLLIGFASIVAALAYSGGPRPYASAGLGEVFVFTFFGPVATIGTAYVQAETIPALTVVTSIPIGLLATAILVVNNMRDIETDVVAGKRTLAVRLGPRGTRHLYAGLIAGATLSLVPIALVAPHWARVFGLLIPFGFLHRATLDVYRTEGAGLVKYLGVTSLGHLLFGIGATVLLWR